LSESASPSSRLIAGIENDRVAFTTDIQLRKRKNAHRFLKSDKVDLIKRKAGRPDWIRSRPLIGRRRLHIMEPLRERSMDRDASGPVVVNNLDVIFEDVEFRIAISFESAYKMRVRRRLQTPAV
jgi:hypothetical protein